MSKSYVLDTSAIFTLTKAEEGSDVVEDILNMAKKGKDSVYLSFISFMELYYVTWQEKSEDAARELIILVKSLPVHRVDSNERLTLSAGRLKANHRLSVADAFIAATAIEKGAVLVHKDPELEVISKYTETIELPYK
ncbi:MAG: type II toxin-antitoxin system VapC family toxin [Thermodesulfovibrionales bacterium]|nr:type II toxin-antitoxin system VapC family toxin [Euryarchaeota archaeon]MDP3049126.1 type II toxin-antitoxin system VapC family toxin [Thermodesulfovibrionales bacterium]